MRAVAPDPANRRTRTPVPPRVRASLIVALKRGDELYRNHSVAAPFKRVERMPATSYGADACTKGLLRLACSRSSFRPSRKGAAGKPPAKTARRLLRIRE